MTHTPGPWFNANGMDDCNGYVATTDKTSTIRIVSCHGVFVEGERKANARLIAAAPELLEALKEMLEWARRVKVRNPGMEVANAINAIAKAEGRD